METANSSLPTQHLSADDFTSRRLEVLERSGRAK